MKTYFDCWASVAAALFSQAVAGEPEFVEGLPKPLGPDSFGWAATLSGDVEGRFAVVFDGVILTSRLMGEEVDQKSGWSELVRETFDAAAGELLATAGRKCHVVQCEEIGTESQVSHAFQLRGAQRSWTVLVHDELRIPAAEKESQPSESKRAQATHASDDSAGNEPQKLSPGLELLLDVELEASLRFGSREMPLGEILDLGPGDVVELDRHITDPVDLIVGDKIVARGEVVLVSGNFSLRVTEVAAPRKRLESIRCLF